MRRGVVAVVAVLTLSACSVQAEEPPETRPEYSTPETTEVSAQVAVAEGIELPVLARDSAERRARRLTVRVRNISCLGVGTGSGFAIAPDVLVTNRHVLAGASAVEVSTWNGRSFRAAFSAVGVLGDVGVAVINGKLPLVGAFGKAPGAGAPITAVGYPLGGPLTISPGVVVDRVDGGNLGVPGAVVRITAGVRPGNSGGPLLNRKGRVVGIVYAIERSSGLGLAIPVDTFRRLVRVGGYEDVPPCGSE
jgi:S1-C subfamily serine protease